MAVSTGVRPVVIPIGQADIRLPIAFWVSESASTGDASGGNNETTIEWSRASPEQLVSVEDVVANVTAAGAARDIMFNLATQQLGQQGVAIVWRWTMQGVLFGTQSASVRTIQIPKLILNPSLGQLSVVLTTTNVLNEILRVSAWGYIWSVEALMRAGGAVRPGSFLS